MKFPSNRDRIYNTTAERLYKIIEVVTTGVSDIELNLPVRLPAENLAVQWAYRLSKDRLSTIIRGYRHERGREAGKTNCT